MEQGDELPTAKVAANGAPRVFVFTAGARPLSAAQAKRARFVKNLKDNFFRFKEALEFVERFARINGVSEARAEAVRKAASDAVDELTAIYEAKIRAYEARLKGEGARPPGGSS